LRHTSRWKPFPYLSLICAAVFCTRTAPFSITQIQSVSLSASSRWCVVRMMVLRVRLREEKTSQTLMRLRGSRPEVGSSKISSPGRPRMAIAMDSFRLLPPDSYLTRLLRSPSMPRVRMVSSM
jgi:hypothetical protein